jgi:hypothetical protein
MLGDILGELAIQRHPGIVDALIERIEIPLVLQCRKRQKPIANRLLGDHVGLVILAEQLPIVRVGTPIAPFVRLVLRHFLRHTKAPDQAAADLLLLQSGAETSARRHPTARP